MSPRYSTSRPTGALLGALGGLCGGLSGSVGFTVVLLAFTGPRPDALTSALGLSVVWTLGAALCGAVYGVKVGATSRPPLGTILARALAGAGRYAVRDGLVGLGSGAVVGVLASFVAGPALLVGPIHSGMFALFGALLFCGVGVLYGLVEGGILGALGTQP